MYLEKCQLAVDQSRKLLIWTNRIFTEKLGCFLSITSSKYSVKLVDTAYNRESFLAIHEVCNVDKQRVD